MMTSTYDEDKKTKLKLGKKTDNGYKYSAKIDFNEDLSVQISRLMQEKKAKDALDLEIKKLAKYITKFPKQKRRRNLDYYYTVGKNLSFLDSKKFRSIKQYSIYRRIAEEVPNVLPNINKKIIQKHLETMYRLGHIKKGYLKQASWDQWYEIMKFKNVYKKPKLLKNILQECNFGASGPFLRDKIKNLIK